MFEDYFKALGEPTRLRIIKLLSEKELCVCQLEQIMQVSQPRISQHLKILKQTGLVTERRDGQRRVCRINYDRIEALMDDFRRFLYLPLKDMDEYREDFERMQSLDDQCCD